MKYPNDSPDTPPEIELALVEQASPTLIEGAGDSLPALGDEPGVALSEEVKNEAPKPGWLRRNSLKLALGAFVVGAGVTIATNPLHHIEKEVVNVAPWAAGGIVATEAMWIGGAALMAASAGKRIGNPLSLRGRWEEISQSVVASPTFRTGLIINTAGALGTAGIVAAGAGIALPPEVWPGAFGVAFADIASTVAIRSGVYKGIRDSHAAKAETEESPKVAVRKACLEDMDRLADIDLLLFEKAYGQELPLKEEVKDMLTKRYQNNPDWMFVSEVNGEVQGFVSAFRTNVPLEDFVSWEHSTANGTLDGKVDPKGKYVYVSNMTIMRKAVFLGAEDMLLANLFANGIRDGVEYGYFVARIPYFKRWLQSEGHAPANESELETLAEQYVESRDSKGRRLDRQLKMYEAFGFSLQRRVANAFEDDASMNYGVVFKADVPPKNPIAKNIKPVRMAYSRLLREVAKHPKILKKVF